MPRKQHKYHYIYKTTCTVTGNYYIGMHSTSNLDDGYMGSGKRLKRSINKYGIDNHAKEILEFLDNRESLAKRESEIVNEQSIEDPLCMNLKPGGFGGFCNDEHRKNNLQSFTKAGRDKMIWLWHNDAEWKEAQIKSRKSNWKNPDIRIKMERHLDWNGRKHKEETKVKIGITNSKKQTGKGNSQYGTCWITNGKENKKIQNGTIVPDGWKLGRKIK